MHLFFQSRTSNYEHSIWMVSNFWPIWIMFFYVFFCNIIIRLNIFALSFIILYCYIIVILLHLIFTILHIRSLLVPYTHVSIKSIDPIHLWLFQLKEILLISSLKRLCLSLLNLCCVFNISLLFFNSFWSSLRISILNFFFSKYFIFLSISAASKQFL